jgi:ECF transporter S component (folate family)
MRKTIKKQGLITVRAMTYCAMLAAISIVMARLLSFAPAGNTRWSLDKFPLFLAGMLFGPLAGGLTGFAADAIGSMMQYGFNPVLCPPAILFGLAGGIFRYYISKNNSLLRLMVSYLVPTVLGAVLYQSAALAWVFNSATFTEAFIANLGARSIQFAVVGAAEIAIIYLLIRSKIFNRMGLWPLTKKEKVTMYADQTSALQTKEGKKL